MSLWPVPRRLDYEPDVAGPKIDDMGVDGDICVDKTDNTLYVRDSGAWHEYMPDDDHDAHLDAHWRALGQLDATRRDRPHGKMIGIDEVNAIMSDPDGGILPLGHRDRGDGRIGRKGRDIYAERNMLRGKRKHGVLHVPEREKTLAERCAGIMSDDLREDMWYYETAPKPWYSRLWAWLRRSDDIEY